MYPISEVISKCFLAQELPEKLRDYLALVLQQTPTHPQAVWEMVRWHLHRVYMVTLVHHTPGLHMDGHLDLAWYTPRVALLGDNGSTHYM